MVKKIELKIVLPRVVERLLLHELKQKQKFDSSVHEQQIKKMKLYNKELHKINNELEKGKQISKSEINKRLYGCLIDW